MKDFTSIVRPLHNLVKIGLDKEIRESILEI